MIRERPGLGHLLFALQAQAPLAGAARRALFYVDLMGAKKPHLLLSVKNNLVVSSAEAAK